MKPNSPPEKKRGSRTPDGRTSPSASFSLRKSDPPSLNSSVSKDSRESGRLFHRAVRKKPPSTGDVKKIALAKSTEGGDDVPVFAPSLCEIQAGIAGMSNKPSPVGGRLSPLHVHPVGPKSEKAPKSPTFTRLRTGSRPNPAAASTPANGTLPPTATPPTQLGSLTGRAIAVYFPADSDAHMKAFLQSVESHIHQYAQSHGWSPEWYHGDCIVVKHGRGVWTPAGSGGGSATSKAGMWDRNTYKGPLRRDEKHSMDSVSFDELVSPTPLSPRSPEPQYWPWEFSPPLSPEMSPRSPPVIEDTAAPTAEQPSNRRSMHDLQLSHFDMTIPDELRIRIFSMLDVASLYRASQVCTEWRRLTNEPLLWSYIYKRRWGRTRADSYVGSKSCTKDSRTDWKDAVKRRLLLDRNWELGQAYTSVLRGHSGWVTSVDFYHNRLASASYDGTVRIWNTQTGNSLQILYGEHQHALSPLWCIQMSGHLILAGSSDSVSRVWDMHTGQVSRVFSGHAGGVKCLHFDPESNRIFTGSDDKTVRIFDLRSPDCLNTIQVPGPVSCLATQQQLLITSSKRENDVFCFELSTGNVFHRLTGHSKPVYCMHLDGTGRLITGSRDRQIFKWDLNSGNVTGVLIGHQYTVMALHARDSRICSASADQTVRVWDSASGTSQILRGHTEPVMSVKFDYDKIASGSADKTVMVWDFLRG